MHTSRAIISEPQKYVECGYSNAYVSQSPLNTQDLIGHCIDQGIIRKHNPSSLSTIFVFYFYFYTVILLLDLMTYLDLMSAVNRKLIPETGI